MNKRFKNNFFPSFVIRIGSLLTLFLIFSQPSFGQRGFYQTDSLFSSGVKIVDGGKFSNAQWCLVKKRDSILRFSPNEVLKYGINGGQTYVSKEIQYSDSTKRVFLELLAPGEITLFYFAERNHSTYFIEKDSTSFFEFPKGDKKDESYFQKQLQSMTSDFPEIKTNARHVHYNNNSLSKFINEYNNRKHRPFPYFKFGIAGMAELSKLLAPGVKAGEYQTMLGNNELGFKYENTFGGGFFADIPINLSDFSCHMEAFYVKHAYSYFTELDTKYIDFIATISSVKLPVLLRYTIPTNKIRPFANAGVIFSLNMKKDIHLYQTEFNQNRIVINEIATDPLINDFQKGIAAGLGIEYILNYKHSLFFEVRTNRYLDGNSSSALNSSDIQFITSINF